MKKAIPFLASAALAMTALFAQDLPVHRLSDMIEKIEMKELVRMPIGSILLEDNLLLSMYQTGVTSMEVPREWSDGAPCAALRVSHVLVANGSRRILGGLGSNVYPTIAEGAFAMTNEIVSAVSKVSGGRAMVEPLRFHEGKYGEMKFWWRPKKDAKDERELVVRCYVSAKKQMAVCTLIHTKGDDIRAEYIDPNAKR